MQPDDYSMRSSINIANANGQPNYLMESGRSNVSSFFVEEVKQQQQQKPQNFVLPLMAQSIMMQTEKAE